MDRLDRGRDPGPSEPPAIVRMEQLDVLEARHERHAADGRFQGIESRPDPVVPDRVDDRRDAGGRGARRERGEALRRGDEDAALGARGERLAGLRLDRLEECRGPRGERPVGEELQPAQPGPIDTGRQRIAAPQARFDRRVDLLLPDAGVDAERQPAARREAAVGLDPAPESLLHRQRARVMDRHDPELDEPLGQRGDEPVVALVAGARDVIRDEAGRRLVEHPGRIALVVAPDEAAGRIVCVSRNGGRDEGRTAGPERMMVVGPQRHPPPRRDPLEVVGRRPAAPAIGVPAVTLDPVVGGEPVVGGADQRQALVERLNLREVDALESDPALGEVEVRIGQARDRDLVRVELEADGERVGPRLELDRRTGKRDAAAGDADRLDPAEPRVAGERRDPPGDKRLERHGSAHRADGGEVRREVLRIRDRGGIGEEPRKSGAVQAGAKPERQGDACLRAAQVPRRERTGPDPGRSPTRKRVGVGCGAGGAARRQRDGQPVGDRTFRGGQQPGRGVPGPGGLDDEAVRPGALEARRSASRPSRPPSSPGGPAPRRASP